MWRIAIIPFKLVYFAGNSNYLRTFWAFALIALVAGQVQHDKQSSSVPTVEGSKNELYEGSQKFALNFFKVMEISQLEAVVIRFFICSLSSMLLRRSKAILQLRRKIL